MKFSSIGFSLLSILAPLVLATPNANQAAYIGYATLNGDKLDEQLNFTILTSATKGTKGGIGGATTTVTSLAALKTTIADDTARVVMVAAGQYGGAGELKVGGNKSIIGISPGPSLVGM
ncbi:hypothetical protein FRC02_005326 [Tulasnella sp. 418]|nr:hypothetical protein FRC02_005326 [Tulasnella sp. 418]